MPSLTIAIPQDGPFVQIMIGVSSARSLALRVGGAMIPPLVSGRGLVDTGASISAIDRRVAQQLGLGATSYTLIHTPSTEKLVRKSLQIDPDFQPARLLMSKVRSR